MAKPNISLWGATYSGAAGVTLPTSGGGTATFPWVEGSQTISENDTYDVTSLASIIVDVAEGGTPKPFVIRPDAELVHTWSMDELLVEDHGATLPAYATSAKVIVTGATLTPTISVDFTNYDYFVMMRGLAIPVYNTTTKVKGRCDYTATSYVYELAVVPANTIKTIDGSKTYTSRNSVIQAHSSIGREVYWTSATAMTVANNATYGAYVAGQAPTISSSTLTIKAPNYGIRGSTTYMTSGAWSSMTDIREQYIIEVWRAPKGDVNGWEYSTVINSIFEDIRNGGTLT